MYGYERKVTAEAVAYALNHGPMIGKGAYAGPGRTVAGYEIGVHDHERAMWGVIERWQYSDKPELGTFGGAFLPRNVIDYVLGIRVVLAEYVQTIEFLEGSEYIEAYGEPTFHVFDNALEAAEHVRNNLRGVEPSSCPIRSARSIWYSDADPWTRPHDGVSEHRSFHIMRATPTQERAIWCLLTDRKNT